MSGPGFALQSALFERLTAEVSCPVYDGAPMDTPKPYVSIDREIVTNARPLAGRKREIRFIYLSVWSSHVGQAEIKRINGEIFAALDRRRLPLSAGRVVAMSVERADAQRDADGKTYSGSVTVRVLTTH